MMARVVMALVVLFLSAPAMAQSDRLLNIDPATKTIDITTGFDGSSLVVYGIRRTQGDVAIVIRGPAQSVIVRRKAQVLGIWMNRASMVFDNVPSYYDFALSRTERDLAPFDILRRNDIGLDALDLIPDDGRDPEKTGTFREALIRNQQERGLFPLEPKPVTFIDRNFFKASFYLPANVPTGLYQIQTYLVDGGTIVETQSTELKVGQTGFSANIYLFAQLNGLAYGFVAVLMALVFGWGANAILRRD